jgi:hypothetical protein
MRKRDIARASRCAEAVWRDETIAPVSRLAEFANRDVSRIADMRCFPLSADARGRVNANCRLHVRFDEKI